MRRREFITLLGAAAWPRAARAQQEGRVRRIAWLIGGAENDPERQAYVATLRAGLTKLGWVEGRNLRFDIRFGANDVNKMRAAADELVGLAPDLIVTTSTAPTKEVQQRTRTIPILFVALSDPVSTGLVANIARPEGNLTGFANLEPSLGSKWLELLKEIAPKVVRVGLLANPETHSGSYYAPIEAAAPSLSVQTIRTAIHKPLEIVRAIDAFAVEPNGGLIVLPDLTNEANRELILDLAAQHRLPAIYADRYWAAEGGLIAYGIEGVDLFRRAPTYVDRILRGAKVNELPVQFPTRFELVVNLKTAKAIGLTIPEAFLLRADELIE